MLSDLRARVVAESREKLILSIALPRDFCAAYFSLQRFLIASPRALSPSFLDQLVGFSPAWTAVYQSLYLFLPLPWLCTTSGELRRYRHGFMAMTAVAFAFFLMIPVAGPRPDVLPDHALYRLLAGYDRNLNAFPSLHVALTVYTLLLAFRLTRQPVVLTAASAWAALIIYSTMATKQHWAADVVAGLVLALAADRLAARKENVHAPIPHRLASSPGIDDHSGRLR